MAKRIALSLDDEQMNLLSQVKGFGKKDAEKVKNVLLAYLSEKGYLDNFNQNMQSAPRRRGGKK